MSRLVAIVFAIFLLFAALPSPAQDQEVSLGDLAREARKSKRTESEPQVIDNDNLGVMMDKAEAERLNDKPVFSIDRSGKTFRMTSPDGTCSLSFDAKMSSLISTPHVTSDLPQYELAKLEAGAAIHDGVLEVTVHNGTTWELKEIVVGLTLLNQNGVGLGPARLIAAAEIQTEARRPDATTIYHLKATAPADSKVIFKSLVNDDLDQAKDWHWALVAARGVPPAPPTAVSVQPSATSLQTGIASATGPAQPSPATQQTPIPAIPLVSGAPAPIPGRPASQSIVEQPPVSTPAVTTSNVPQQ
jgi:hypothetical protein